jgi:hypothetical protein
MHNTITNISAVSFRAGKLQEQHVLANGATLALHLSSSSSGSRKWGIWRKLRVLCIQPGTVYQSIRSKGVEVIWEREFDLRSQRRSAAVMSAGEEVYIQAVARDRQARAKEIAGELLAGLFDEASKTEISPAPARSAEEEAELYEGLPSQTFEDFCAYVDAVEAANGTL